MNHADLMQIDPLVSSIATLMWILGACYISWLDIKDYLADDTTTRTPHNREVGSTHDRKRKNRAA